MAIPLRFLLSLALVQASLAPARAMLQEPAAAETAAPDWNALIGPYPQPGSPEAEGDLAVLLWLQRCRTGMDVARASAGCRLTLAAFAGVLGHRCDPSSRPKTAALLDKASGDLRQVLDPLKQRHFRPRPFETHAGLVPAVQLEETPSYPSGHATRGIFFAHILAELEPGQKSKVIECGHLLGYDRALAGVHWPSDVKAGQTLGAAYARFWLADADNRRLVAEVKEMEWACETKAVP
jgi:membrane-associated phospholipid phosphatase